MNEAVIVAGARTAVGRAPKGTLRASRPDDMGGVAIREALRRAEGIEPEEIEDVIMGCAMPEGTQGMNVARQCSILGGLPETVPAQTVNRFCSSGLQIIALASERIVAGHATTIIAGGTEHMSTTRDMPNVAPNPKRLEINPAVYMGMGLTAEQVAREHKVSREDQDAFAATSHQLAAKAWDEGKYDDITVSVAPNTKKGVELTRDETVRGDSTPETLAGLRTVFRSGDNATVTAGNASPMNDGASAVWLGSERGAQLLGREPIARIAGRGAAANEPQFFGEAPVEAANIAVRRAGITWDDVAAVELNEAFAAQSLACLRQWGVDQSIVNQWGGAIAIGHPLGASGTRVLGTLARRLQESGQRWGVASLCIGVGQGLAVVLENENAQG